MRNSSDQPVLRFLLLMLLVIPAAAQRATSASSAPFPAPDFVLRDATHREPKSGVQLGPGGQLTITSGVGTPTAINSLSFSADGRLLAAGKDFGRVALWDVPARKFLRAIETGQGEVSAVALTPDGKTLATAGDHKVKLWDLSRDKLLNSIEADEYIHSLTFNREGDRLAFADNGGTTVIEIATMKKVLSLGTSHAAIFGQDGRTFIASDEAGLSVFSVTDWSKQQSVPLGKPYPYLIAAHTPTDTIAVYQGWRVRLLRLGSGEAIPGIADALPADSTGYPKFAQFSADGGLFFVSVAGRIWMLTARTGSACGTQVMYSGSGALSADSLWLAAAKDDSIMSSERTDGVWIWDTSHLLTACGMSRPYSK